MYILCRILLYQLVLSSRVSSCLNSYKTNAKHFLTQKGQITCWLQSTRFQFGHETRHESRKFGTLYLAVWRLRRNMILLGTALSVRKNHSRPPTDFSVFPGSHIYLTRVALSIWYGPLVFVHLHHDYNSAYSGDHPWPIHCRMEEVDAWGLVGHLVERLWTENAADIAGTSE